MHKKKVQLLEKYRKEAAEFTEEAKSSFEKEKRDEANCRRLKIEVDQAESDLKDLEKEAEETNLRWREAKGESTAARENCQEINDTLAIIEKRREAASESLQRIENRLRGKVTSEVDLAKRSLDLESTRFEKMEARLRSAENNAKEKEALTAERKKEAEAKREEVQQAEENIDRLKKESDAARDEFSRQSVEGGQAMTNAWYKSEIVRSMQMGGK